LLLHEVVGILEFMQSTLRLSPLGSPEQDPDPVFNVLIAYEDFETGKQAKQTYDFLVENLEGECIFANQMWKFDVLSIPKLREMAAKDAAAADIVIISCRDREFPHYVHSWMESWLMEEHRPLALVALIDRIERGEQSGGLRNYLSQLAKRGKMEFFAQPEGWSAKQKLEDQLMFHRDMPNLKTFSALAGAIERENSYSRWGINE
jgi:hypothetical protein